MVVIAWYTCSASSNLEFAKYFWKRFFRRFLIAVMLILSEKWTTDTKDQKIEKQASSKNCLIALLLSLMVSNYINKKLLSKTNKINFV